MYIFIYFDLAIYVFKYAHLEWLAMTINYLINLFFSFYWRERSWVGCS